MSADDTRDPTDDADEIEPADVRAELDRQRRHTDNSVFDEDVIDLLSRMLDTDTRARIYVHLRRQPSSTVEEIAEGTGLYPSAVRRVLSDLHTEGVVEHREHVSRDVGNAGEYTAIPPNELIDVLFTQVRDELDSVFGFDRLRDGTEHKRDRTESVTIPVEEVEDDRDDQ